VLAEGANLRHPTGTSLMIELTGNFTIETNATIDVSGHGYAPNATYPGEIPPGARRGGSHMGYGGYSSSPGSTYGSV